MPRLVVTFASPKFTARSILAVFIVLILRLNPHIGTIPGMCLVIVTSTVAADTTTTRC
jgi:hypothetical protein